MIKKLVYRLAFLRGRLSGRKLVKIVARIGKMFGWPDDDIKAFCDSIAWQLDKGKYWIPPKEDDKNADHETGV